jgi:hypothetical protein
MALSLGAQSSPVIPSVHWGGRSLPDVAATQKALLSAYCRLDFEGVRLQADGWSRFKPHTSLRANPEFSRFVVVSRYDVEVTEPPTSRVVVKYLAVGIYDLAEGYTPAPSPALASFRVQEQSEALVITEFVPAEPHVSIRAALAWMNARLNDPKTAVWEQAHLRQAIAELSKAGAARPSAP